MAEVEQDCCTPSDKLYLAEVKKVYAGLGGECDAPDCEFNTPFFDDTLSNEYIILPIKDSNFVIKVCDASRWATGQWVQIQGIGKFEIVNILSTKQIVLVNRLDTPEVGSTFQGSRRIWLTEPVFGDANSQSVSDLEDLMANEEFTFCAYTEASTSAENGNPLASVTGGSVCVPCEGTTTETAGKKCYKYFSNIFFRFLTIGLPKMPATALSEITFKRDGATVTEPMQEVLIHPTQGDLYKRSMPTVSSVDAYHDGGRTYVGVPSDYATNLYALIPDASTGKPAWRELDFNTTEYIGVALASGNNNIKTILQSALGITLPDSGSIVITVRDETAAWAPATSGTKARVIDLASPSLVITGTTSILQFVTLPVVLLLNPQ